MMLPKVEVDKYEQALYLTKQIVEGLTDEATLELFRATDSRGMSELFDALFDETYRVLFGGIEEQGRRIESANLGYLSKLSASVEEELRCQNLGYFITSVLPNFEMNPHHYVWSQIPMLYKKYVVLAARDHGKSLSPLTSLRLSCGKIKLAKDIKVGDMLMGPDSKPRKVTAVGRGVDENMYEISQYRGNTYTVNSRHKLTLLEKKYKYNNKGNTCGYDLRIVDIDIKDYLKLSEYQRKTRYYGFKVCSEYRKKKVSIEPYYLGLWLGDGSKENPQVTNIDKEVINYIKLYANRLGIKYTLTGGDDHNIIGKLDKPSKIRNWLREYDLFHNKHIPECYLRNNKDVRLKLLAGLIDSDGNLHDGCYYIGQKSKTLAAQIQQLAHSLGFHASMYEKHSDFDWMKREDKHYISYEVCITGPLHNIPVKIARKRVPYFDKQNHKHMPVIDGYELTVKSPLKVKNVGKGEYVSITVDGDRRFLLGDNTVTHNSFMYSNAYPSWELYRYKPKTPKERNSNRGFLFSFSIIQATDLLSILKDSIENNEILKERLYNKEAWSKTDITCKNRARLTVKGFGSAVRGAHPYWMMVDDGLKDNVLYSADQNQKNIDYFHAVIENLLTPGGSLGLVGTPFKSNDLYGHLRENGWPVFEFPGIYPDGSLLWENRWNFKGLMEKRKSQGNLIFSREILCRPVTSDSTIFPIEILNTAFIRMESYTLVATIESFPVKFKRVVTGCDFAISGSVGADYSVFSTFGIDESDKMWLVNVVRGKGMSYAEQLGHLKNINANFRPDVMMMENNVFQQIFAEGSEQAGLPVLTNTTGKEKNNLREGLPSLAILFERGMFRVPTGDQQSKDFADLMVMEFSSVAFTDKGLQGTSAHDDITMSFYQAVNAARSVTINQFDFTMV